MDGIKRLRTNGALTYDGFTTVVMHLLESAWGQGWGIFTEEAPQLSDGKDVDMPRIVYGIKEVRPGVVGKNGTQELRPRLREVQELETNGHSPKLMHMHGQAMDYYISFTVYAENNRQLDIMTEAFLELMMTYGGFITQQGLRHIFFEKMVRESSDQKDKVVARTLYYRVGFERIVLNPTDKILSIQNKVLEKLGD